MGSFAIVFPGQGSQTVGMLAELGEQYDVVKIHLLKHLKSWDMIYGRWFKMARQKT